MSILDVELFEEPTEGWVKDALARERANALQRRQAALIAGPALASLADVLKGRSGQPYKLRALLYSLWNGKPASLVEIVHFDWEIRQDLLLVLAAFGYADNTVEFFYSAIEEAVRKAGQWTWFLEERYNVEQLREHVKSVEGEAEQQRVNQLDAQRRSGAVYGEKTSGRIT